MSKRIKHRNLLLLLVIAALIGSFIPAILKIKVKAHVIQQMASFKDVCLYIADHNTPPLELPNQRMTYDPNALGHSDKILFYSKCFTHEIVTLGDGHINC